MSDTRSTPNGRTGLQSMETWAIVALLLAAGIAVGLPLGAKLERGSAEERINAISQAYNTSLNAKDDLVRLCLGRASEASQKADEAVGAAKEVIEKATEQPK